LYLVVRLNSNYSFGVNVSLICAKIIHEQENTYQYFPTMVFILNIYLPLMLKTFPF
jgi:hypothetical protein